MNNGLGLLLLSPLLVLTLTALFGVLGVLFGSWVHGAREAAQRMPGRATLLGAVNLLFASIVIAALSAVGEGGPLQLIALLLLAILLVAVAFGLAAMAPLIGARLTPDASPVRQVVWGSLAMLTASLTPLLGWFVLFPYLALRGLGALIIHLFTR